MPIPSLLLLPTAKTTQHKFTNLTRIGKNSHEYKSIIDTNLYESEATGQHTTLMERQDKNIIK